MDSIVGYFRFGSWHTLLQILWALLPYLAMAWVVPYKDVLWWPWPWLNLQVLCVVYCFTEKGLAILLKHVFFSEMVIINLVTFPFSNVPVLGDEEISKNQKIRAKNDAALAVLNAPGAWENQKLPAWVPYDEDETRIFFWLLNWSWQEDEYPDEMRQKKYKNLAKLYSLPRSFFPMLMKRAYAYTIVLAVYAVYSFGCWLLYVRPTQSEAEKKFDAALRGYKY
jgi:hypothetical protein